VTCKTCEQLIALHQMAVRIYTEAANDLAGMGPREFRQALEEVEKLHADCVEANKRLLEHWRTDHDSARAASDKF